MITKIPKNKVQISFDVIAYKIAIFINIFDGIENFLQLRLLCKKLKELLDSKGYTEFFIKTFKKTKSIDCTETLSLKTEYSIFRKNMRKFKKDVDSFAEKDVNPSIFHCSLEDYYTREPIFSSIHDLLKTWRVTAITYNIQGTPLTKIPFICELFYYIANRCDLKAQNNSLDHQINKFISISTVHNGDAKLLCKLIMDNGLPSNWQIIGIKILKSLLYHKNKFDKLAKNQQSTLWHKIISHPVAQNFTTTEISVVKNCANKTI